MQYFDHSCNKLSSYGHNEEGSNRLYFCDITD